VATSCSRRPRQSVPVPVRPPHCIRLAAAAARGRRRFPARLLPFLSRRLCAPCMRQQRVLAAAKAWPHKAADTRRVLRHVPGALPPDNTFSPSPLSPQLLSRHVLRQALSSCAAAGFVRASARVCRCVQRCSSQRLCLHCPPFPSSWRRHSSKRSPNIRVRFAVHSDGRASRSPAPFQRHIQLVLFPHGHCSDQRVRRRFPRRRAPLRL
jgi:hypothetical protein